MNMHLKLCMLTFIGVQLITGLYGNSPLRNLRIIWSKEKQVISPSEDLRGKFIDVINKRQLKAWRGREVNQENTDQINTGQLKGWRGRELHREKIEAISKRQSKGWRGREVNQENTGQIKGWRGRELHREKIEPISKRQSKGWRGREVNQENTGQINTGQLKGWRGRELHQEMIDPTNKRQSKGWKGREANETPTIKRKTGFNLVTDKVRRQAATSKNAYKSPAYIVKAVWSERNRKKKIFKKERMPPQCKLNEIKQQTSKLFESLNKRRIGNRVKQSIANVWVLRRIRRKVPFYFDKNNKISIEKVPGVHLGLVPEAHHNVLAGFRNPDKEEKEPTLINPFDFY